MKIWAMSSLHLPIALIGPDLLACLWCKRLWRVNGWRTKICDSIFIVIFSSASSLLALTCWLAPSVRDIEWTQGCRESRFDFWTTLWPNIQLQSNDLIHYCNTLCNYTRRISRKQLNKFLAFCRLFCVSISLFSVNMLRENHIEKIYEIVSLKCYQSTF